MIPVATGLVLRSPEGTRYLFDPGALCLELLTTGGPGALARHEVLHEPADFTAWLGRSRLRLDPARLQVTPEELAQARTLRDTLWGLVRSRIRGQDLAAEHVATLNDAAAEHPLAPLIDPTGAHGWQTPAGGGQATATIARDAVELFTGPFAARIRECGADDCFLVFVDTSRPGRRRWCAMERCGNRQKARALRARRDSEENPLP